MALPSTSVFEVRPGAGSDTACGGGFDSAKGGTDYSQQNSAQYNFTDLLSISSLVVASASHNFVAADVGNFMQITAGTGFTVGFYEIVSVATNQATLDRSPGTVGTGGTYFVGGALATVSKALSLVVASNIIYVKASGTYTVSAAQTITLDSSAAPGNPLSIIGYTTTRTDNGQFTWTTSTNSISLVEFTQARNVRFQNIIFSTTAGTPGKGINAKTTGQSFQISLINCKLSGFTQGVVGNFNVDWAILGLYLINCRITGCTSHGVINSGSTYIFGCLIDNNGGDGANWSTGTPWINASWVIDRSIFYKNAANGLNITGTNSNGTTGPSLVINQSVFSTNTLAGILMGNVNNPFFAISNSIFDVNSTYGIDSGSGSTTIYALYYNNAFYLNTTAATRGLNAGIGTITLSVSPYTSLAGLDFSLNSNAGGGTSLKAAGFPGVLQVGGTGFADVGALQTMGGGGTVDIQRGIADVLGIDG